MPVLNELTVETTKALATYATHGEDSAVYRDVIEAARVSVVIPEEDVIAFALKIGNHLLNGSQPGGFPQFHSENREHMSAPEVRKIVCNDVDFYYSRTRKDTLDRWKSAILKLEAVESA